MHPVQASRKLLAGLDQTIHRGARAAVDEGKVVMLSKKALTLAFATVLALALLAGFIWTGIGPGLVIGI